MWCQHIHNFHFERFQTCWLLPRGNCNKTGAAFFSRLYVRGKWMLRQSGLICSPGYWSTATDGNVTTFSEFLDIFPSRAQPDSLAAEVLSKQSNKLSVIIWWSVFGCSSFFMWSRIRCPWRIRCFVFLTKPPHLSVSTDLWDLLTQMFVFLIVLYLLLFDGTASWLTAELTYKRSTAGSNSSTLSRTLAAVDQRTDDEVQKLKIPSPHPYFHHLYSLWTCFYASKLCAITVMHF